MVIFLGKNKFKILLGTILALTFFLTFYDAWNAGYSNAYYTAAVKSMLSSWHNFFFASFDPGGFMSVDKPALGLWLQGLFGLVFGVKGWSLILAESICAVVSVAVLYQLVQKRFGKPAGLIAALCLALTPIFVAVARTNNLDSSLTMVMLLSAWAAISAAEKGSLKLLLLSMVVLGLGFNIKSLQAAFILPAIVCVYFFAADNTWSKRFLHLMLGVAVFVVVSLSWVIAVDLTPEEQRPYVSGSQTNSEIELLVGYNGIQRVFADADINGDGEDTEVPRFFINEGGEPGAFRLWNKEMGAQISWLTPLSFFGMLALALGLRNKEEERKHNLRALIFWGLWILPMIVYFSIGEYFHSYYLTMLAPGLAALSGIGLMKLWNWYQEKGWKGDLLILAISAATAMELHLLSRYPSWHDPTWLMLCIAGFGTSAVLLAMRIFKINNKKVLTAIFGVSLAALLAVPAASSFTPVMYAVDPILPVGGPELVSKRGMSAYNINGKQKMIAFLEQNYSGETYLVAVSDAMTAAPLMLTTGKGVLATGGFTGTDHAITVAKLSDMVSSGMLRYVALDPRMGSDIMQWVKQNGKEVFKGAGFMGGTIYDLKEE